jgi:3-dehydroquinate dehydratase/shikimate dehydrogenase
MTEPQLCVTETASTTAELRRRRDAVRDADLVELRLDTVADPDAAGALQGRRRPAIITCRAAWEGGHFTGSEEERRGILAAALSHGAEYVDVEWRAGFSDLIRSVSGRRIVLSSHDFDRTPSDLAERARAMQETGAELIKIAVTAHGLRDVLRLRDVDPPADRSHRMVLIAMGPHGIATRVLPWRFGSAWSYAGAIEGVGQLTAPTMLNLYRFRSLGPQTGVYALVGSPVEHSVSPQMHNAAFRAAGIDAVYLPLLASDADDFVEFARGFGLEGASVTIPFKVAMFDRVDEVQPVARQAGAINTIHMNGTRWTGGNTDVDGFLQPLLARGVPLKGTRAAVLGAGGAARAVALALAAHGADVTVYARRPDRAAETAGAVGVRANGWPPRRGAWDLLVNATPIGMHPHVDDTPVAASALSGRWVYDLIYNPPQTRLLRDAAAAGCATIGGLEMLVAQAERQFEWWTGTRPPAGVMRAAAEQRLSEMYADENHVV